MYRLQLRNASQTACTLTGLPVVQLLRKTKRPLPTHVVAAHPGRLSAVLVILAPAERAHALARFAPDVPPGCGARASWLRVLGKAFPIAPPTPVCQRGRLQFDAYAAG